MNLARMFSFHVLHGQLSWTEQKRDKRSEKLRIEIGKAAHKFIQQIPERFFSFPIFLAAVGTIRINNFNIAIFAKFPIVNH